MIGLLCFALAVLTSPFKSKLRLEAENAVLRHQLMVLRRRLRGRVRLTNHDRWFLITEHGYGAIFRCHHDSKPPILPFAFQSGAVRQPARQ
ncbi:hypothetical protein [Bradyrhizobium sp. NP1]|uniref:hypothetical protein n=1 Tax=Bradyrhizobium sp. NP1 TaxID=3049772 RepID=UPI0025A4D36B|nr:hypothetical protein [Bradyrhizobium sp. NP1]WJR81014.1 hypothetical protein QOU61_15025 [Bradyrhizobium sp. NP1]